jgi:signal transduction histidine kinase
MGPMQRADASPQVPGSVPVTQRHPDDPRGARRRGWRAQLTPEERALREARQRANRKLGFLFHLLAYASVEVFLLFVAGFRAALIVGLGWGIGLVFHYFSALVAPGLRRRLIAREVERQVADTKSAERRQIEDRHARSLEQLAAGVAHEIRNPITAAKSLVQQMGEDPSSKETLAYANVALAELDRVERSISHLLRFAREEDLDLADVRLRDVVDSALATFADRAARLGVKVAREIDSEAPTRGDAEKLRRVVINLVGNAFDALEQAGTPDPCVRVLVGENLAGDQVWLRVRDNGPGMPSEICERIFDPFYTSKQGGTGLGLALTRKVVEAHGGQLEVSSTPGEGTHFVVTLPRLLRPPPERR